MTGWDDMKKIGLLINPIAGMGGRVGLKGTDGVDIVKLARERGAVPESSNKAVRALQKLLPLRDEMIFLVANGPMGELAAREVGLQVEVVMETNQDTTATDSLKLLEAFRQLDVDLILFAGGDGTAKDVVREIGLTIPVIGIPTGVKIHSPVFAITPETAGNLAYDYIQSFSLPLIDKEVIDIEETAFRADKIETKVYGYLSVPDDQVSLQNLKSPSPQDEASAQVSAALQLIDLMEDGVYYIIGSGSTTSHIMKELDLPVTQLGVDIIKNKHLVAKDVSEQEILNIIDAQPTKLVVSPMGGQGYLFGRGNQQLSEKVLGQLSKDDILIVSTHGKINTLYGKPLWVYTGDAAVDEKLSGYYKVIIGYGRYAIYKVATP